MSQAGRPLHMMAKPVCGVCNLACRYCYYTGKPAELYPATQRPMMTDGVLANFTRQYLAANPVRCEFGWQGGEPLLAGREFFAKAVAYQKELGCAGQTVANAVQTNGTLLDDAWCEFLAANRFLVGVSIDGPADVHDIYRRDAEGGPTFVRAWAGLELLRKHGVEFNVLATITRASAPRAAEVYRFLVDGGVRHVQFIPVMEPHAEFSCGGEELGRAMIEIFRAWKARDVGRVSVRFIDDLADAVLHGEASTCVHSSRCPAGYVAEWNGDVYVCDHFVEKEWRVGNLMETPLAELVERPILAEFAARKAELAAGCRVCEYIRLCRGGCPKHHVPMERDAARGNHFCAGYKMFFAEAAPQLRRMTPQLRRMAPGLPRKRPSEPATAGQSQSSATPLSAAVKPGRNDRCPCGSGRKFKQCCGRAGR